MSTFRTLPDSLAPSKALAQGNNLLLKMFKQVSWSDKNKIIAVDKFPKKFHRDLFYSPEDYDSFELEAIEDELFEMEENGCLEDIGLSINRWMESEGALDDQAEIVGSSSSCAAPTRPNRRLSCEYNQQRRISIEMSSSCRGPRKATHRGSSEVPVSMLGSVPEDDVGNVSSGPKRPNRRTSIEMPASIVNSGLLSKAPPGRPERRPTLEIPICVIAPSLPRRRLSVSVEEEKFRASHPPRADRPAKSPRKVPSALAPSLPCRRESVQVS